MEAIILAGGFGTRLRSVCADRPKPMALIHDKPFLEHLMNFWLGQGVDHFILSVGYLHEQIIEYFGNSFQGIPIDYAIEKEPLGTGGGLLLALKKLRETSQPFLLLNGDTFFNVPLKQLTALGPCTLSLFNVPENTRYDGVELSTDGQITALKAKNSNLINGGCYLIFADALSNFPEGPLSLEKDILPTLIKQGHCFGHPFEGPFIDIGIPEDYERSVEVLSTNLAT